MDDDVKRNVAESVGKEDEDDEVRETAVRIVEKLKQLKSGSGR